MPINYSYHTIFFLLDHLEIALMMYLIIVNLSNDMIITRYEVLGEWIKSIKQLLNS